MIKNKKNCLFVSWTVMAYYGTSTRGHLYGKSLLADLALRTSTPLIQNECTHYTIAVFPPLVPVAVCIRFNTLTLAKNTYLQSSLPCTIQLEPRCFKTPGRLPTIWTELTLASSKDWMFNSSQSSRSTKSAQLYSLLYRLYITVHTLGDTNGKKRLYLKTK